ncbi:MAG: hypothetical protein HC838_11665 [Spirulinaceae cyanobacterium RM2_2_10]|nr:hypothetical protein [Spirulinaceae cyanobacterium SM2_1_0]NJO20558.1 hypothetical protein [Spirulinaceae cyanobacterium RM2_2_10]
MLNGNRKEILKNAAANHRASLRRSLQNRLEAARTAGNDTLVRQLEAEASYLRLS